MRKNRFALASQIDATIKVSPLATPTKTRGVDHRQLEKDIVDSALFPDELLTNVTYAVFSDGSPTFATIPNLLYRITNRTGGRRPVIVWALGTTPSDLAPLAIGTDYDVENDVNIYVRGRYDVTSDTFTPDAPGAVPDFNPAEAVPLDAVRAFIVDGGRRLWRATTALNPVDFPPLFVVPEPGAGPEWEELSPAEAAGARLIYVSQAQARTMVAASDAVDQFQPGTLYRINARSGRPGGEHVVALAVTSRAFHPVAALVAYDAGTDEETVSAILYTLNEAGADTATALGSGGGGGGASTFAALTGAPRANALLDADFSGLEDAVATKASRAGDTFTGNVFLPATADTSATRAVARGEVVTLIAAAGGSGYTAGTGLTLTGNTFSLNLASANTWSAAQTFSVAPVLPFATAPGAGTLRVLAINSSKQVVDAQPVYAQIALSETALLGRLSNAANWDATGYWIPGTPEIDDIGRWGIVSISGTEYMIRIDAAGIPQRGKWLRI